MSASAAVPGFQPTVHGFRFSNWFEPQPTIWLGIGGRGVGIGDAKNGLCGGFCLAVRDRFERGELPPPDTRSPNRGQPLFHELVRRQVESFRLGAVPLRFLRLGSFSSPEVRARHTVNRSWPKIKADIDRGRLAMIGLVRSADRSLTLLGIHHQVLGYAYDLAGDEVTIRIYDPNHPNRDDVTLTLRLLRPSPGAAVHRIELAQSTGEPLVALLSGG